MQLKDLRTLASPNTNHMSQFALLCQAARLLGQVLHTFSDRTQVDNEIAAQLDRTLHSMLAASMNVDDPCTDQMTFVYRYALASY